MTHKFVFVLLTIEDDESVKSARDVMVNFGAKLVFGRIHGEATSVGFAAEVAED